MLSAPTRATGKRPRSRTSDVSLDFMEAMVVCLRDGLARIESSLATPGLGRSLTHAPFAASTARTHELSKYRHHRRGRLGHGPGAAAARKPLAHYPLGTPCRRD